MTPEEPKLELVMPFVVCDDRDGPFDADAFVAGWTCGALGELLPAAKRHGLVVRRYVDPRVVPQLDLLAMKEGFTLTSEPWEEHPDEWTLVTFDPFTHGEVQ